MDLPRFLSNGCSVLCFRAQSVQSRVGETFGGRVSKLFINFTEIFSHGHENFEDQNKVLEFPLVIIK
jgi:hypothetical protein